MEFECNELLIIHTYRYAMPLHNTQHTRTPFTSTIFHSSTDCSFSASLSLFTIFGICDSPKCVTSTNNSFEIRIVFLLLGKHKTSINNNSASSSSPSFCINYSNCVKTLSEHKIHEFICTIIAYESITFPLNSIDENEKERRKKAVIKFNFLLLRGEYENSIDFSKADLYAYTHQHTYSTLPLHWPEYDFLRRRKFPLTHTSVIIKMNKYFSIFSISLLFRFGN